MFSDILTHSLKKNQTEVGFDSGSVLEIISVPVGSAGSVKLTSKTAGTIIYI